MKSLWYRGCHWLCARLYFERITVLHPERLPTDGPILYVVLHRNGAVDGFVYRQVVPRGIVLISTQLRRSFFARLFFCGIAVARKKDEDDQCQNDAALGQCTQLLAGGGELVVSPEGTSALGPRHLPFKSGAVSIALEALTRGVPLRVATRLEWTGGKGANLSLLTQRGFPLPRGFVVTAPVYREFITGARDWLRRVAALPFHDAAALQAASAVLPGELSRLPLPPRAAEEIVEHLGRFPEGTAFSVRSSSTLEDLASAAFAGQHETFVNVVGAADVLDRERGCFVSLWADRAIAYRHQQGFDHAHAAMAVVIQQMVPSESAGVGFSINPVNGRLGEMVINAKVGLGESVVSGDGDVDQWILDKSTRAVRSANIGSKSRQVVSAASGTREVDIAGADAAKPSLSESVLAAQGRQQKAAYLVDQACLPEWILGQSDAAAGAASTATGDMLAGLAGSPGVAEGPVFLVLTPDDFATFPKGAVLVARTTNPTWTPLFYSGVAVVTESGGPLSHGAVTAREMGIPAVMSVKESLTRLQNGQRVRVDGTTGRVELLTS